MMKLNYFILFLKSLSYLNYCLEEQKMVLQIKFFIKSAIIKHKLFALYKIQKAINLGHFHGLGLKKINKVGEEALRKVLYLL